MWRRTWDGTVGARLMAERRGTWDTPPATERGSGSASGSGSFTGFAPLGFVFPNGSSSATFSISGTVQSKLSLSGNYSGGGENGTFSLSYNTLYERPSSLAIISGIWLGQNSTFNISS